MLEEQFEGFVIKQIFTIILIHENEIFTNVHIICEILHRQDVEKNFFRGKMAKFGQFCNFFYFCAKYR